MVVVVVVGATVVVVVGATVVVVVVVGAGVVVVVVGAAVVVVVVAQAPSETVMPPGQETATGLPPWLVEVNTSVYPALIERAQSAVPKSFAHITHEPFE